MRVWKLASRREFLKLTALGASGMAVLAACAPAAAPTPTAAPAKQAEPTKPTEKPAVATAAPKTTSGKVTLVAMHSTANPDETIKTAEKGSTAYVTAVAFKELRQKFAEKFPNIEIQDVVAPWAELRTKQQVAITGGQGPDLVYNEWGAEFAMLGYLAPLDLKGMGLEGKIHPPTLEGHSYKGKVYCIPWNSGVLAMFVNAKRLTEAGLDPAKLPKTWTEFEEQIVKTTNPSKNWYGFIVAGSGSTYGGQMRYAPFLWSNGGDFFDKDFTKATWNSPEGVAAIEYLSKLSQKYSVPGSASAAEATHADAFFGGVTAFFEDGPWSIATATTRNMEFTIMNIPMPPGGTPSSLILGNGAWGVAQASKYKDEATKWVQFIGEKDTQLIWVRSGVTRMLSNVDAMGDKLITENKYLKPFADVFMQKANHPLPTAPVNDWEIKMAFRTGLEEALRGAKAPKQAWDDSANEATKLLQQKK